MKRLLALSFLLLAGVCSAFAHIPASGVRSSRTEEITVRFNNKGELKIVQFTDLHYDSYKAQSRIVLKRIDEVLSSEKPDLVVITGDLVYSTPVEKAFDEIFAVITRHNVPFCVVFGNHDPDFASRELMYDYLCSFPGCVMPKRNPESKAPDYTVPVIGSNGRKIEAVLYCIDSNSHLVVNGEFIGYDAIHPDQVDWYRQTSSEYRARNGKDPLPALAFFHIPLPEYHDAVADESCTLIGTRMEYACSPRENTGMFEAIKECGDVMGVFVGHDHDDDYCVMYKDILLGYGRFTGGNTEYNNLSNGARVIILKEGKRSFDSYVVLKGGEIKDRITYPDSFLKTPWRGRPLDPECR